MNRVNPSTTMKKYQDVAVAEQGGIGLHYLNAAVRPCPEGVPVFGIDLPR